MESIVLLMKKSIYPLNTENLSVRSSIPLTWEIDENLQQENVYLAPAEGNRAQVE